MTAKNIKNSNSPKSPSLRFPEFSGEWEEKYGNEIFENISDKNHNSDLPILAITQEYGAIPRDLIDYKVIVSDKSVDAYKVVQVGDFIISLRSFQGGIEYSNYKGICSPAYIILRPKIEIDRLFFKHYLKTTRYIAKLNKNLEGIRDGKMISYKYFSEIPLIFPSIQEQYKISNFLSKLDKRIEAQRELIEDWEAYKKGVMQKLFSQEIRFPNFSDEWEEKTLGEVLSIPNRRNIKVDKDKILSVKLHLKGICKNENIETLSLGANYFQRKAGQFIYGKQNFFNGAFGIIPLELEGYFSSTDVPALDIDYSIINGKYLIYFLGRADFYKPLENIASGTGSKRIHENTLLGIKISLPTLEEQTQIANFLSKIDEKIEADQQILEYYQQQKAYFLQNMFV